MPRGILVLFTGIVVTGSGLAQQEPAREKLNPCRVFPRLVFPKPNPLMQGEYKIALDVFDRVRAKLSAPKDTKTARRLLDDLDHKLIAVRTTLWKAEKRAKTAKATRRVVFETIEIYATNPPRTLFPPPNAAGMIFGELLVDGGRNPFLRGDYRGAVVALTETRTSLDRVRDAKAARRIVDTLNRMLLDVRRELWKIEQAQKKQAHAMRASVEKTDDKEKKK